MEWDLKAQETAATRIAQIVVVQIDWGQEARTHLSGALLIYV
jgi:hypothetical protein